MVKGKQVDISFSELQDGASYSPADGLKFAQLNAGGTGFQFANGSTSIPQSIIVKAATHKNLNSTYNNGTAGVGATLTADTLRNINSDATSRAEIDFFDSLSTSNLILVKNQTDPKQNGIYTITTLGTNGATAWVLTRYSGFDQAAEIVTGMEIYVTNGKDNYETFWILKTTSFVFGTDNFIFGRTESQFGNIIGRPCICATTGTNISFGSAPNVLDGHSLVYGDRILVKDQTTPSQNGPYVVDVVGSGSNGSWIRTSDYPTGETILATSRFEILTGTLNAKTAWHLDAIDSIIGTDSLSFIKIRPVLSTKYINGLKITYNSSSIINFSTGSCRSQNNAIDIILPSILTADISASGAGGLDTGTVSSNTLYAVHVISDYAGNSNTLLSLSNTSPSLPSGYVVFRHIFWIYYGTSTIVPFQQVGIGNDREFHYWDDAANLIILNGGTQTITFATVSPGVGGFVPVGAQSIILKCILHSTAVTGLVGPGSLQLRPVSSYIPQVNSPVELGDTFIAGGASKWSNIRISLDTENSPNTDIQYILSSAGLDATLVIEGFLFSV